MITEHDLQEAIAECLGQRRPDASTCIKLAAYYTIQQNLYPKEEAFENALYSFAAAPSPVDEVTYDSDTEFSKAINGRRPDEIWSIMDELMSTLSVMNPRLYKSVMNRVLEK